MSLIQSEILQLSQKTNKKHRQNYKLTSALTELKIAHSVENPSKAKAQNSPRRKNTLPVSSVAYFQVSGSFYDSMTPWTSKYSALLFTKYQMTKYFFGTNFYYIPQVKHWREGHEKQKQIKIVCHLTVSQSTLNLMGGSINPEANRSFVGYLAQLTEPGDEYNGIRVSSVDNPKFIFH